MTTLALQSAPLLNERRLTILLLTCAAFFGFAMTEHNPLTSRQDMWGTTTEDLESSASSGQLKNQLGFTLLGFSGICVALLPGGIPWRAWNAGGLLLAAFLVWSFASITWSLDPGVTARKLGVLGFCVLGAIGCARRMTPRDMCRLAFCCLLGWICFGLLCEFGLGTFRPWKSEYRFSGTMHPNGQGGNTALLCLTSYLLARETQSSGKRLLLIGTFVLAFALLILTKSRTSCLALMISIGVIEGLRVSPVKTILLGAFGATCGAALFLSVLLLQLDVGKNLADVILLGRNEHLSNLNGRTELWELLLTHIAERPLNGYGYRGFWTPDNINDVSEELFWGISSAHSIYLETLLGVGLIGLVMLVGAVLISLVHAGRCWIRSQSFGHAFLLGLYVYGSIDGLMESGFVAPSFLSWLAGCGLAQVTWCQASTDSSLSTSNISQDLLSTSAVSYPSAQLVRSPAHS